MTTALGRRRIWTARAIAVLADLVQIVLAPLFVEGGISIFDAALDILVGGTLTYLVGWHWAFVPSFAAELVPGLDLVPSWTIAVFLATRERRAPESLPQGRVIDVEPVRED